MPPQVLVVDDTKQIRALMAVRKSLGRVLAIEGWGIVSAANGAEALKRLVARQPDLLITDLCMAEVSGWDLLFHKNLQRPALPVFVINALPPPAAGGAERFAAEYFPKATGPRRAGVRYSPLPRHCAVVAAAIISSRAPFACWLRRPE